MSAESRRKRQIRDPLVRYLGAQIIGTALGVPQAEILAWSAGDARVSHGSPEALHALYGAFEQIVPAYGFANARDWFITENAGLDGMTPAAGLSEGRFGALLLAATADSIRDRVDLAALDIDGRPRVGLAGDWHGNLHWAEKSLKKLSAEGLRTLLHVGDFGLWPRDHGAKFIRRVNAVCEFHDITILATDGNHEDHDRLDQIEPVNGIKWLTDRIGFFQRGHRWHWNTGTTMLSIGGAPSVDRNRRTAGSTWWPQEVITDADVEKASAGGHVDVMISHDAPEPGTKAVQDILDGPFYWSPEALDYAVTGREQITRVARNVHPYVLIHGHYHVADRATVHVPGGHDHDTEVVSLACDEMAANLAVLDLETREVTFL